jgi:hypothetical protein
MQLTGRRWCRMKFIPHKYQSRAIDLVIKEPKLGLFLDMGLG